MLVEVGVRVGLEIGTNFSSQVVIRQVFALVLEETNLMDRNLMFLGTKELTALGIHPVELLKRSLGDLRSTEEEEDPVETSLDASLLVTDVELKLENESSLDMLDGEDEVNQVNSSVKVDSLECNAEEMHDSSVNIGFPISSADEMSNSSVEAGVRASNVERPSFV